MPVKVPSDMWTHWSFIGHVNSLVIHRTCELIRFRSTCTFMASDQNLYHSHFGYPRLQSFNKDWSDCAYGQADLTFCRRTCQKVHFLMLRLKWSRWGNKRFFLLPIPKIQIRLYSCLKQPVFSYPHIRIHSAVSKNIKETGYIFNGNSLR